MQPLIDLKKIEQKKVIKWLKSFFWLHYNIRLFRLENTNRFKSIPISMFKFFFNWSNKKLPNVITCYFGSSSDLFPANRKPFVNVADKSKIQIIIEFSNRSKIVFNMLQMYFISGSRHCKFDKSITQTNFLNNNLNVFSKIICTR